MTARRTPCPNLVGSTSCPERARYSSLQHLIDHASIAVGRGCSSGLSSAVGRSTIAVSSKVILHLRIELFRRLLRLVDTSCLLPGATSLARSSGGILRTGSLLSIGLRGILRLATDELVTIATLSVAVATYDTLSWRDLGATFGTAFAETRISMRSGLPSTFVPSRATAFAPALAELNETTAEPRDLPVGP